jgi:hypothetical protein
MKYIIAQICKSEGELNHGYITSPTFQIISLVDTLEEAKDFKRNIGTQVPEEWFIILQAWQ